MSSPIATPRASGARMGRASRFLEIYVWAFLFLIALPILLVSVISFSPTPFLSFPMQDFSLRWYGRVFEYEPFLQSLWTSVELATASTLVASIVAVPCALALARSQAGVADWITVFLLSPISIPGIVLGFALLYYLSNLSVGPGFLALFLAHTVIAIPYISRTVLSVYRTVPRSVEESAVILGASRIETIFLITLPQIRYAIYSGTLFAFLISLDNLPISFFFSTAQTNVLPVVMMSYLQNQYDPSIAAIATIQMLFAVIALILGEKLLGIGALKSI